MIRNQREYQQTKADVEETERLLEEQKAELRERGLSSEQVRRVLGAAIMLNIQRRSEIQWYDRARQRNFAPVRDLTEIGRILIGLRIANGLTQRALAERLGVTEATMSRDERNEYHGITLDRAQRILDALGEKLEVSVRPRHYTAVGYEAPQTSVGQTQAAVTSPQSQRVRAVSGSPLPTPTKPSHQYSRIRQTVENRVAVPA